MTAVRHIVTESAIENIIIEHKSYLLKLITKHVGNWHEGEDLYQEAMIKFIKSIRNGHYVEQSKIKGYLSTLSMNVVRDYWRSKGRRISIIYPELFEDLTPDTPTNSNEEVFVHLEKCINKIPTNQIKRAMQLRLEGYSYKKISKIMGINTNTVGGYIIRGKRKVVDLWQNDQSIR